MKGPTELILTFVVIMQLLIHILFIAVFFPFLALCARPICRICNIVLRLARKKFEILFFF